MTFTKLLSEYNKRMFVRNGNKKLNVFLLKTKSKLFSCYINIHMIEFNRKKVHNVGVKRNYHCCAKYSEP